MDNELVIRKENIDWSKLIDLTLSRQNWGKVYILYTYGTTTISCVMKEFNFEESTAWFRIKIEYTRNCELFAKTELVRYVLNHFTLQDFKMHLNKKLMSFIKECKERQHRNEAEEEFIDLKHEGYSINDEDIITAGLQEELETLNHINDEFFLEDCMDILKDKTAEILNKEFNEAVEEYIKNTKMEIVGLNEISGDIKKETAPEDEK